MSKMKRREFLKTTAGVAAGAHLRASARSSASAATTERRLLRLAAGAAASTALE